MPYTETMLCYAAQTHWGPRAAFSSCQHYWLLAAPSLVPQPSAEGGCLTQGGTPEMRQLVTREWSLGRCKRPAPLLSWDKLAGRCGSRTPCGWSSVWLQSTELLPRTSTGTDKTLVGLSKSSSQPDLDFWAPVFVSALSNFGRAGILLSQLSRNPPSVVSDHLAHPVPAPPWCLISLACTQGPVRSA